jgi:ribosomal protein S27AE
MTRVKRKEIIARLREKGADKPCPRCGHLSFSVIDGFFNQTIQENFSGFVIGGQSIPAVVTACNNCGYIAQHSLGVLGFLERKESEDE